MADAKDAAFDPYYKWLGIPKDQRPPTHYQLLGLTQGEGDREVIEEAAVRQSTYLRGYQVGPHAEHCTRLLNEIARAQQVLLHPQKKQEYDERLAQRSSPRIAPATTEAVAARRMPAVKRQAPDDADASFSVERKPVRKPASARDGRRGDPPSIKKQGLPRSNVLLVLGVAGGVVTLGLVGLMMLWFFRGQVAQQNAVAIAVDRDAVEVARRKFDNPIKPVEVPAPKPQPAPKDAAPFNPAEKIFGHWLALNQEPGMTRQLYVFQDAQTDWHIHFSVARNNVVVATAVGAEVKFLDGRIFYNQMYDLRKTKAPERIESCLELNDETLREYLKIDGKASQRDYVRVKLPETLKAREGSWYANFVDGTRLQLTFDKIADVDSRGKLSLEFPNGEAATKAMIAVRPYGNELAFEVSLSQFTSPRFKTVKRGILFDNGVTASARFEGSDVALHVPMSRDPKAPPVQGIAYEKPNVGPKIEPKVDPKSGPDSPPDAKTPSKDPPKDPPTPEPVKDLMPPAAEIAAASKLIQEQFAKDYAAAKKSPADRGAFAEKLFKLGQESADDRPARYVLFCEARDLASAGGKWSLALEAIESLREEFGVNSIVQRDAALALLVKNAVSKTVIDDAAKAAIALVYDSVAADRIDIAQNALGLAKTAAGKTSNFTLLAQTKKLEPDLKRAAQDFERMKKAEKTLAASPDDAAAHLDRGRYLAFYKADWDQGLDHLAKGTSGDLQQAAKRDRDGPQEGKKQQEVGDLWWGQADKETGWARAALLSRAGFWYRQAVEQATGLSRTVLTDRLKVIDSSVPTAKTSTSAFPELVEAKRLKGHAAAITGLQVFTDGKTIASCSLDGSVRLWDLAAAKQTFAFDTTQPVLSFSFSPSRRFLAAVAKDRLRVYDWTVKQVVVGPTEVVMPGAFWTGDDTLFSSLGNGSYEQRDFLKKEMSKGPRFPVPRASLSGHYGSSRYVSLGNDVRHFRASFGNLELASRKLDAPDAVCAAFSKDAQWLAIASTDKRLRLFETANDTLTATLEGSTGAVRAIAVSSDGRRILSGGDDKIVRLWDVASAKEIARTPPLPAVVLAVAFTADGNQFLSAGAEPVIQLWNLPGNRK